MCDIIVINKGEHEIGTVYQLESYFKIEADEFIECHHINLIKEACLCQINIEAYLLNMKLPYSREYETAGDYYIDLKHVNK